jgi:hypothetical protein
VDRDLSSHRLKARSPHGLKTVSDQLEDDVGKRFTRSARRAEPIRHRVSSSQIRALAVLVGLVLPTLPSGSVAAIASKASAVMAMRIIVAAGI